MSESISARRRFGEGPLSRAAAMVYTLLVVELLLLATTVPGLVPILLLDRDASNLPLFAACAIPVGPAVSAALYALHHRSRDLTDLKPAVAFWRGYRANLRTVLWIWVAWLVWLTIVAVNLAHFEAAAVPGWWAVLLVVVAVSATLWVANAVVITSLFLFRVRDVARLAAYFLVNTSGVTLANACLVLVAAALTAVTSEVVLALLGSVFAFTFLWNCRPMIAKIQKDFTA